MKKLLVILAVAGILAIIPLGISLAQTTTATTPPVPNQGSVDDMIDYCQDMMGGGGMMGGGFAGLGNSVTLQRIASVLGIAPADLQTSLSRGETIAQIAQSKKVETKLVIDAILAPESETLQLRVKYGYITQAQATAVLEQSRLRAEQAIQRPLYGYGNTSTAPGSTGNYGYGRGMMSGNFGGRGMMGGGGGGGGMMGW